jgi:S1-C subfamily serine protease
MKFKKIYLGITASALFFAGCTSDSDNDSEEESRNDNSTTASVVEKAKDRGDADSFSFDFELKDPRNDPYANLFKDPVTEEAFDTKNLWNKENVQFLGGASESDLDYLPDNYYRGMVTILGQEGLGSGFVFAEDGDTKYIMTNSHVVDQNTEFFYVLTYEGEKLEAPVADNVDFGRDLAVLEVESEHLEPLDIDPESFSEGERVVSVGSPLGEVNSVGAGEVLTSVGKTFAISPNGRLYYPQYSTITTVNTASGNSGGPVFNEDGEVAGVLYAGGEDFAALVDMFRVQERIDDFLEDGKFEERNIGWECVSPTSSDAVEFIEQGDSFIISGLGSDEGLCEVESVTSGSPADEAGIEEGDLVYEVWTTPIPEDEILLQDLMRSLDDASYGLAEPLLIKYLDENSPSEQYSSEVAVISFFEYEEIYDNLTPEEQQDLDDLEEIEQRIQERFNELVEQLPESQQSDLAKLVELEQQAREEVLSELGIELE